MKDKYKAKAREYTSLQAAFEKAYSHHALHRRVIKEASAADLSVPPEVLAEYPDLCD